MTSSDDIGARRVLPPMAPVSPYVAAFIMRRISSQQWRTAIVGAQSTNPGLASELESAVAYLRSGQAWWLAQIRQSASGSGSAEVVSAEVVADLNGPSSLGTSEVAVQLGVSARRVRQLAVAGTLSATRAGRSWVFDPDSVKEFSMRPTS